MVAHNDILLAFGKGCIPFGVSSHALRGLLGINFGPGIGVDEGDFVRGNADNFAILVVHGSHGVVEVTGEPVADPEKAGDGIKAGAGDVSEGVEKDIVDGEGAGIEDALLIDIIR